MFFRRKPDTHALALWTLVIIAAFLFTVAVLYITTLVNIRSKGVVVFGPKTQGVEAMPTLFGRVLAIAADQTLTLDTKQGYSRLVVDEGTKITTVTGNAFAPEQLRTGAVITATGKDLGGGVMLAESLAVIENGDGAGATIAPAGGAPSSALNAPTDWKIWATMPALIGWGSGETLLAVRDADPKAPAVSVLLYGKDGKIAGRLELDVQGYKRLKSGNDFLTPGEAEARLAGYGLAGGEELTGSFTFTSSGGKDVALIGPDASIKKGLLATIDGELVGLVPWTTIAFTAKYPAAPIHEQYWLSPDKRWVLAVFTADTKDGPVRSLHLVDIEQPAQP